jgi:hypothetical protein
MGVKPDRAHHPICNSSHSTKVRALQHFYCRSSNSAFSIKQHLMNRTEVNAHFGGLLPVRSHDMYHAFVSYR